MAYAAWHLRAVWKAQSDPILTYILTDKLVRKKPISLPKIGLKNGSRISDDACGFIRIRAKFLRIPPFFMQWEFFED